MSAEPSAGDFEDIAIEEGLGDGSIQKKILNQRPASAIVSEMGSAREGSLDLSRSIEAYSNHVFSIEIILRE
jgi:hypothetical protein